MNILFISHTFPYPPHEGIKLPVYYLIKNFSEVSSVTLLTFITPEEKIYIENIKKYCSELIPVVHKPSKNVLSRAASVAFNRIPYSVKQFFSKEMLKKLELVLSGRKFDIIFFDFLTTVKYRELISPCIPTVLHYHDAMSMLFYRNYLVEKNLVKKFYWFNQYKKILNFEKKFKKYFDKITVVSSKDAEWLINNAKFSEDKVEIIPNGVDTEYFSPDYKNKIKEDYPSIIFRGIMNFQPNISACEYFLKDILPLIRREIPDVKFYIVGPNPTKRIKKFSSELNIVTGYVEDVREYIVRSTVNVCPMISGSGIKNKILESLSLGIPTVSTSLGCEGIPELVDNENILVADTPEEFAKKTIMLIKDKSLREKISAAGQKLVKEQYSWTSVAKKFFLIFEKLQDRYKMDKISIIVPVYNEFNTIEIIIEKLFQIEFGIEKEIVVVDDGSYDGTKEVLQKLRNKYKNLKIIFHNKNLGKGSAIRTGIKESTGEIIAIQDADIEYEPEELKVLLQPILLKKTKVVYGSRFLKKNPVVYTRYYLGNKFLSWLVSFLYGYKITDSYTCYKVFHRDLLKDITLKSKRFEFEAEITCKAIKRKYKILEIPITYSPRTLGQGKKIKLKDAYVGVWTIIKNLFY